MPYRTPDAGNPRVRRTRERVLTAARELLSEVGPAGLTYSLLAERAGVTRQTLYRHWPARPALLLGLILEGVDGDYPEPGQDPGAVAAAWLASLLEPSGTTISVDEYALLSGPVLARIFFERREVADAFIDVVVAQWLAGPARTITSADVPPPLDDRGGRHAGTGIRGMEG